MKLSRICSWNQAPGSGSPPSTSPKNEHLKRLDILTLFPAMFDGPVSESLLARAQKRGIFEIHVHNLRDWSADDRHKTVDDRPYGGGPGMVIQAEPVSRALQELHVQGAKIFGKKAKPHVIYLSPQGRVFTQAQAARLAKRPWIILVCGHYEGLDERAIGLADEEVSIGDYVLTGGEVPAMVLTDAVCRLVPGVVKEAGSLIEESFQKPQLDYPHYTRPAVWKGQKVPDVLLSGDHQAIREWREKQALAVTRKKRPDLLKRDVTRRRR